MAVVKPDGYFHHFCRRRPIPIASVDATTPPTKPLAISFPRKYPKPVPFPSMTVTSAILRWLAHPRHRPDEADWSTTNSPTAPEPAPAPAAAHNSKPSTEEDTAPTSARRGKNKRKHVSAVVDVHDMAKAGFYCCKKLKCVESFVLGTGDVNTLRAEQRVLAAFSGAARSNFVHTLLPLVAPEKGAMLAGRQFVCNAFFRKAFNVSKNMIQALKNNPGSPVLKG